MNFILSPFVAIMNRLKYFQKFLLIFLLFTVPIISSLALIVYNIHNDINFAKSEQIGLEGNMKLQALVQNVQQHRGLSAGFLGGNKGNKEKMAEKQEQIQSNIEAIEQYLTSNQEVTLHSDDWKIIRANWDSLRNEVETLTAPQSFDRHTNLIATVLTLASAISDSTNLSLDSDVIRHHLSRIITNELINATEYMGQARAVGSNVLAAKTITTDQQFKLSYQSQLMAQNLSGAEHSMGIVLNANEEARQNISAQYNESMNASKNFSQLISNEILNANEFTYDSTKYFDEATVAIDTIFTVIDSNATLLNNHLGKHIDKLAFQRTIVIITSVIATLLAIILFIAFYKSIKESIESINRSTTKISDGDLTERIQLTTNDETKKIELSINNMMDTIQKLISANQKLSYELSSSAEQLSSSSDECARSCERIAEVTQTVAYGSEKQMESVHEANESIKSMTVYIHEVADNSDEMLEMFEQTANSTEKGVYIVKDVLTSMNEINETVQGSAQTIKNLGDSSQKIGEIVSLITDIANQTNLLALNAAIEAARAGEHGKGFAVVAEEVRKLAEQSNRSAGQISSLITDIQKETIQAVHSMEQGTNKVNTGLNMANQVNEVFQSINAAIQNVTHKVKQVSTAVEKISSQSDHINDAMDKVRVTAEDGTHASQECSAASEQQLATMEEISASAAALSSMAEELQTLIGKYKA
ncbi:methyl-accepting chemotaxis protein [Calidifontibacillus oryziterrae]|uniref:methyl-accepting chemotaxis protein n=1 Tax=Calidifontibacillus oryziterrae TaxID=1191699 RepID=UPI00030E2FA9|nr:methyl-accepting chemotaxis protein [Calidifontibacillus oryziterrae]